MALGPILLKSRVKRVVGSDDSAAGESRHFAISDDMTADIRGLARRYRFTRQSQPFDGAIAQDVLANLSHRCQGHLVTELYATRALVSANQSAAMPDEFVGCHLRSRAQGDHCVHRLSWLHLPPRSCWPARFGLAMQPPRKAVRQLRSTPRETWTRRCLRDQVSTIRCRVHLRPDAAGIDASRLSCRSRATP